MKKNSTLKILVIIVAIVLISLISFVGIYKMQNGRMVNILPDYLVGKDVKGYRMVTMKVKEDTKTDNNTTEEATTSEDQNTTDENNTNTSTDGQTNETNTEENIKTAENFEKSKVILEKRLKYAKVEDYTIRLNQENGTLEMDLPDNTKTDQMLQYLSLQGKFTITDTDTKEVLLSNDQIQNAKVMYYPSSNGTTVYLNINFNKEGTQKLEEMTKTYVQTTDDSGKTSKKMITMKLDDETLLTTYFGETISNGQLQITIGSSTNDSQKLSEYVDNATYVAMVLNNETMPIAYQSDTNQYMSSYLSPATYRIAFIVAMVIVGIAMLYWIIRYHANGFMAAISAVGYGALLLLIIRYTNIYVTLGSITAICLSAILYFVFTSRVLKQQKEQGNLNETILNTTLLLIPIYVIAIVACFSSWLAISSFGTTLFWGLLVASIYEYFVVKNMMLKKSEDK